MIDGTCFKVAIGGSLANWLCLGSKMRWSVEEGRWRNSLRLDSGRQTGSELSMALSVTVRTM